MTLVDGLRSTGHLPVRYLSSWMRFLAGFAVLYGVLAGTGALDTTGRWELLMLPAVVLTGVAVEWVLYRMRPVEALRSIGLGRPRWRGLLLAAVVSGLVLLVRSPVRSGERIRDALVPGWFWVLVGVFAFHGVAEELVWRGFAFRRLREGRSFWTAVWWTMPLIAVTHLPIVFTVDPVVGIGAMVVAAITSIPFSYLYRAGRVHGLGARAAPHRHRQLQAPR